MEERLQKVLAQAGIASRRKCEELIAAGRVVVNGAICRELGQKVDASKSTIYVDDELVTLERKVCILLHKPTSYVSTVSDPEGRRTVMQLLEGVPERVFPVGRLDYDTSGLLLFTNDGSLMNQVLHPSRLLNKIYRVTIIGMPDKETIGRIKKGIELEDGPTMPAQVRILRNHPKESVLEITIHEGRNRQVRRMFEEIGFPVKRLRRVQFGPLILDERVLFPGKWRMLTRAEWAAIYAAADLTPPSYPLLSISRATDDDSLKKTQRSEPKSKNTRKQGRR